MDIYMIWAADGNFHWLVDAMDDDSIQANDSGWLELKQQAYDDHGYENIRIIKATVDMDAVEAAFKHTPTANLTIKENN